MVDGYKNITAPEEEMLTLARQNVRIRPGFDGFKKLCDERGWELNIVSGGIDFYVRAFLPQGVSFYSYVGKLDKYWKISLPPGIELAEGADFKVTILENLKKKHPRERTVFIGDGRNDFPVAHHADIVFAVKGSRLAGMCAEANIPFTPFTHFDEVTQVLKELDR
jgi:2-hydroxy-3-keto-5-methylthiopentenyl-1-phosphate phosphatase